MDAMTLLDTIKKNRLILGIAGGILLVIIIGAIAVMYLMQEPAPKTPAKPAATPTQAAAPAPEPPAEAAPTEEEHTDFASLVDDTLLEQPLPEDAALVKDELVQLQDIDNQLNEQKTLLEQQHMDADKLLELKEQQLAALEKQLAAEAN